DRELAVWPDRVERRALTRLFDRVHAGRLDTWDAQWEFACRRLGALSVVPAVNLVSNIGFGAGATHTSDASHPTAGMPTRPLRFPLRHPAEVRRDADADAVTARLFRP